MEAVDVVSTSDWWKELPADWWTDLGEDLEMEILGRLAPEEVYRYRRVCNEWNTLLSSNHFITRTWPDAPINKQPWLVLCDLLPNKPCMGFSFYTQTWKPCFSLSFPDEERNIELKYRGSAAGLVLVDRQNLAPRVCNPYSGNSVQLPPMLAIISIQFKCMAEDNGSAYKVVAFGFDEKEAESIVEVYDSSQQRWKVLGSIPQNIRLFTFTDSVCCDASYYCITTAPFRIFGFTIPTLNEEAEPSPISMLVVPIPEPMLKCLVEIQLVTCGSRLFVVAPIEEEGDQEVIHIWELEAQNEQRHPLSTNSTTPWAWKEIGRMPPALLDVFKGQFPPRYKCIGVGDNVCFATVFKLNIEVVVYNLSTRSWSRLPSFTWRNHTWRRVLRGLMAMAFQPRLDTQVE